MSKEEASELILATVKLPKGESSPEIKFNSSSTETIASIIQNISLFPASSHLTSFCLANDSGILPEETILGDLESAELTLIEKNYNQKSMRDHLLKIREMSGLSLYENSNPLGVEYSGIGSGASKFTNLELDEDTRYADSKVPEAEKEELKKLADLALEDNVTIESVVSQKNYKLAPGLKNLALSSWNPVPSALKLNQGHLLYLQVQTLENENFHITACVNGFYVNNSSNSRFDPSISLKNPKKTGGVKFHSLHNLLVKVSSLYLEVQSQNQKLMIDTNPLNYLIPLSSFLSDPWAVDGNLFGNNQENLPDYGKTQLQFLLGGNDSGDLFRDWNEDYQSFTELDRSELPQRIIRERLLRNVGFEFTTNSAKAAISILNDEITPLNAEEEESQEKIYLRNNVFYSFAVDSTHQYVGTGDEESARSSVNSDLNSLNNLKKLDYDKVKHAMTTVVDYAGRRIVCQTPIPGIFNESESTASKIHYGLTDDNTTINQSDKFSELFKPISEFFHLKSHKVWTDNPENAKELVTSFVSKGLKGTDNRYYLIDLFRTTPLDINFVEENWDVEANKYPYKQALLRHELVEEWFRRNVAVEINNQSKNLGEDKQLSIDASKYQFNPDCFFLNQDKLSKEEKEELLKDEAQVRGIANFLRDTIIDEYLKEVFEERLLVPFDGDHLTLTLHKQGINMRYLGRLASLTLKAKEEFDKEQLEKVKTLELEEEKKDDKTEDENDEKNSEENGEEKAEGEKDEENPENVKKEEDEPLDNRSASIYDGLYNVLIQEIIARSFKHVLRKATKDLPLAVHGLIAVHYLNFLFNTSNQTLILSDFVKETYKLDLSHLASSSEEFHKLISKEALSRFRLAVKLENIENRNGLLREIAIKCGLQLQSKNYFQNNKGFEAKNLLNIVPKIRSSIYSSSLVEEIWEAGREYLNTNKEMGLSLLKESLSLSEQIYGSIHANLAERNDSFASIYSELGMINEAIECAKKAVVVGERVNGIDHHKTILSLMTLAYLENINSCHKSAIKIFLYTLSIIRTKSVYHPMISNVLLNIARILANIGLPDLSCELFLTICKLSEKFNGKTATVTIVLKSQYSQALLRNQQYNESLREFNETLHLARKHIGKNHPITKECKLWVEKLVSFTFNTNKSAKLRQAEQKQLVSQAKEQKPKSKKSKKKKPVKDFSKSSVDEIINFIEGK